MKVKRKKGDIVFSSLVRERANYCCENCGTDKRHDSATLNCAHIMGRRGVALRWHPKNAVALCRSCHIFFTEHPFDWADWCNCKFGESLVAELRLVSSIPVKWYKKTREAIYKHMQAELKIMQDKRSQGQVGYLDFAQHEDMHKFT